MRYKEERMNIHEGRDRERKRERERESEREMRGGRGVQERTELRHSGPLETSRC